MSLNREISHRVPKQRIDGLVSVRFQRKLTRAKLIFARVKITTVVATVINGNFYGRLGP